MTTPTCARARAAAALLFATSSRPWPPKVQYTIPGLHAGKLATQRRSTSVVWTSRTRTWLCLQTDTPTHEVPMSRLQLRCGAAPRIVAVDSEGSTYALISGRTATVSEPGVQTVNAGRTQLYTALLPQVACGRQCGGRKDERPGRVVRAATQSISGTSPTLSARTVTRRSHAPTHPPPRRCTVHAGTPQP